MRNGQVEGREKGTNYGMNLQLPSFCTSKPLLIANHEGRGALVLLFLQCQIIVCYLFIHLPYEYTNLSSKALGSLTLC